jgi:curved DNA-binding protein
MDDKDYYKILGIGRDAPQDEIKRAYRKLVRKYHPDVNTGPDAPEAEQKFKDVGEAYEVSAPSSKTCSDDAAGLTGLKVRAVRFMRRGRIIARKSLSTLRPRIGVARWISF